MRGRTHEDDAGEGVAEEELEEAGDDEKETAKEVIGAPGFEISKSSGREVLELEGRDLHRGRQSSCSSPTPVVRMLRLVYFDNTWKDDSDAKAQGISWLT